MKEKYYKYICIVRLKMVSIETIIELAEFVPIFHTVDNRNIHILIQKNITMGICL